MIEVRKGYDRKAAEAMWAAYETEEPIDDFCKRAEDTGLFFGFYDSKPVGAIVFDGPFVHTAILPEVRGNARGAFEFCLLWALARVPFLVAMVQTKNERAHRLVLAMKFKLQGNKDGHSFYVRHA